MRVCIVICRYYKTGEECGLVYELLYPSILMGSHSIWLNISFNSIHLFYKMGSSAELQTMKMDFSSQKMTAKGLYWNFKQRQWITFLWFITWILHCSVTSCSPIHILLRYSGTLPIFSWFLVKKTLKSLMFVIVLRFLLNYLSPRKFGLGNSEDTWA